MINRKSILILCSMLLVFTFNLPAQAAGKGWLISYKQAIAKAKKEKKPILMDFTGSDWCGWCIKLNKEVFSTPDFQKWAKDNVILLEVDFPNKPQPAALKAQNKQLQEKYGVKAYPTILFINYKGDVLGKSRYLPGGPTPWIKSAESIIGSSSASGTEILTLKEGLKKARETNKPLLALKGTDEEHPFLENEQLTAIAGARCIIAMDKGREFHTLAISHDLKDYKITAYVLDVKEDKVLTHATRDTSPKAFLSSLKESLPKIEYKGEWLTDFEKAKAIAASTNRRMLLDFTGSDWCPPCIKLKKDILNTDEFKAYAKENLVLVELDFPRNKKLPAETVKQNNTLKNKYGIRGFPTLIILNAEGKQIGKMGYMKGGPKPFIEKLQTIK